MDGSLPGNSFAGRSAATAKSPKTGEPEAKNQERPKLEKVISSEVTRKRTPLGAKFKGIFMGGDARSSLNYVIMEVLIPAGKEMVVESFNQGIERMIYGEVRSRRSGGFFRGGNSGGQSTNFTNYSRFSSSRNSAPPWETQRRPDLSREARAAHDFGQIIVQDRRDADEVIDNLMTVVAQYGSVTVAELYTIIGLQSTHVDEKWGWTDLRGAGPIRARGGGWTLDLPRPELLD